MALHHAHHTSQLYKVVTPETACVDATIWFGLKVQKSCHMVAERIGHDVRFEATAATTAAVWDNIAVSPEQRKDEHLFQRATRTANEYDVVLVRCLCLRLVCFMYLSFFLEDSNLHQQCMFSTWDFPVHAG